MKNNFIFNNYIFLKLLKNLYIKNYLLIDNLSVSFNNGFTVITGETGTGKSILVGGISLILGKRADLSVNRDKSKKCVIEGVFDIGSFDLKPVFEENELDYDTETILRREISASGKSRAFINDSPVNLSQLSEIGSKIIDIHSQHQNIEVLNSKFQFELLDLISKNNEKVLNYSKIFEEYRINSNKLNELINKKQNLIQSIDYNKFILDEIDTANVLGEDLEKLENIQKSLSNFKEISSELSLGSQIIFEENIGLISNLLKLKNSIDKVSKNSEKLKSISQRLTFIRIELDDIAHEIDYFLDSLEQSPEKLNRVIDKIDAINNLLRKHSLHSIEDLSIFRDNLAKKVDTTENIDNEIQIIKTNCDELKNRLESFALEIHNNRKLVIPALTKEIENILHELGMNNGRFKINLLLTDELYSNGSNTIEFEFLANKGYQFKKIKEAASGGEMSRIMLAIKSIMAKYKKLPSIIFDEIDTGVSGEISKKMGFIMKDLGTKIQTFSITHLPQIAAMGESHFKIYKSDVDGFTKTMISRLNENDRIIEIAKMLEGNNASKSAYTHAKQLLN
ncbi:MAG: DNA repair protein RecN [Flavobacteriaceae bacterium]|nr:DNA repair protein RecN [Flavobacteriaceae bacterium]